MRISKKRFLISMGFPFLALLFITSCSNPASDSPGNQGSRLIPLFSLESGEYDHDLGITLIVAAADAVVHYTTDGSEPGRASPEYVEPILVTGDEEPVTIRAIGMTSGGLRSPVVEKRYTVKYTDKVATPKLSPPPGLYTSAQAVAITCATGGATIHFTTDGTKPGPFSTVYTEPIIVEEWRTVTVRAVAYKEGLKGSSLVMGEYIVEPTYRPVGKGILMGLIDYFYDYNWGLLVNLFDLGIHQDYITQLTTASHNDQDDFHYAGIADYSPDRTRVVYDFRFVGNGESADTLYTANADGSGKIVIFRVWAEVRDYEGRLASLDWSPDGTKIAMAGYRVRGENDDGLFTINPDGSGIERLTADGDFPSWSPDSLRLAFVRGGRLMLMDRDGSSASEIPGQTTENSFPDFHPTGYKLAYSALTDGQWDLYVMNADGSGVERLTDTPEYDEVHPDWSPDGVDIAFLRRALGAYNEGTLFIMTPDGGSEEDKIMDQAYGQPSW